MEQGSGDKPILDTGVPPANPPQAPIPQTTDDRRHHLNNGALPMAAPQPASATVTVPTPTPVATVSTPVATVSTPDVATVSTQASSITSPTTLSAAMSTPQSPANQTPPAASEAPPRNDRVPSPSMVIQLKDPVIAAVLALLWPGLGHLYQQRIGKGLLFMACILGTFAYGCCLGEGRVVYASFSGSEEDRRLPFLAQMWVGLPALPAVIQRYRADNSNPPFSRKPLWGGFQAPPRPSRTWETGEAPKDKNDWTVSHWSKHLGYRFEIGTVYCMIAGLLNLLVVFDAAGGPVPPDPAPKPKSAAKP